MTKHERKIRVKSAKPDKKQKADQQPAHSQPNHVHVSGQEPGSLTETPFNPSIDKHAAMLSGTPFTTQDRALIMQLNKAYGMRYIQRLAESVRAQGKLAVSSPEDVNEKEADRVADEVTDITDNKPGLSNTSYRQGISMNSQTASRVPVKQPPPIPSKEGRPPAPSSSQASVKKPPPIPSKAERPPAPPRLTPGEMYESKPLEGKNRPILVMDRLTYDQTIETFKKWKRPRLLGGLSKSKRQSEAEKYLANQVVLSKTNTSHIPLIINSVLAAYKDTFGENLSLIDEMKELRQIGGGITPESAGKGMGEAGKEAEKEREQRLIEVIEGTIGTTLTIGEEVSGATKELSNLPENQKEIIEGTGDIFSGLGLGVSSIFGFVKAAKLNMKKQGFEKVNTIIDAVGSGLGAIAKGAKGIVGVIKGAVKAGESSALGIAKKVLGPIPDYIKTVVGMVKTAYAAYKGKTKESLEAVWETVKSGVDSIMGTIDLVLSLIGVFGDAVPIVGPVAKGISAILNGIEAGYMFVKKIFKFLNIDKMANRIADKIKELQARPVKTESEKTDMKNKKERLLYIGYNNLKKLKNAGREISKQFAAMLGNGMKLIAAISSLVADILALTGVGAPVGAIFKTFGVLGSIFGSIISGFGAAITFIPKLFNSIRQAGRNLAAKEGKTGKFFRFLGFDPEKSSAKKHEQRKNIIIGIFGDAAKLKTDFKDPSGKDRENANAELTKFKDLEFEIEAIGADKAELYKENAEENDEKRTQKQVKILYDALKER